MEPSLIAQSVPGNIAADSVIGLTLAVLLVVVVLIAIVVDMRSIDPKGGDVTIARTPEAKTGPSAAAATRPDRTALLRRARPSARLRVAAAARPSRAELRSSSEIPKG